MSVLLLGGSGYIGTAMQRSLNRKGIPYLNVRRSDCNYCELQQLENLLDRTAPEFLINAAGYVGVPNVDSCELNKADCLLGNVLLPQIIKVACERRRLPWGHVSTGCIYNGSRAEGHGFREDDSPNFTFRQERCSFYSGSKGVTEEILCTAERCYIWRLRMPFNHLDSPKNYLSKLMKYDRLLVARNSLSQLDECVEACIECWRNRVDFGIYNLTNAGSVTTEEIVELIRSSGVCRKDFKFYESEAEFMEKAAVAPRSSCVLDNSKALRAGLKLSNVAQTIEQALNDWQHHEGRLSASDPSA